MKRIKAVLVEPKKFEFIEEEIPKLQPDEILFKTISVGLCHSDVPTYIGRSAMGFNQYGYDAMINDIKYPIGIGHEPICIVEDVGNNIKEFKAGDLVTGVIAESMATHLIAKNPQMVKIPETNKPIKMCLGEPMMCVTNIIRSLEANIGEKIAIIGCGFMGLMIIAGLRNSNLSEIVAIDLDDKRLEIAKSYGATITLNPLKCNIEEESYRITNKEMFDSIVEITGSLRGLKTAVSISRVKGQGKIVTASLYSKDELWDVEMGYNFMYRSPIVHVVHPWYSRDYMRDLTIGVERWCRGTFPIEELVTHKIKFENISEGFNLLLNNPKEYIKGIITF